MMRLLDLLLGTKQAAAKRSDPRPAPSRFASSNSTHGPPGSPQHLRKDLLRLVLRETLQRNGIPSTWLSADLLRTTTARREEGIHVRFLVRKWEPRLMLHGVAFEKEYQHRLLLLDPQAGQWLMGFSWQFVLEDASACPPMPHAGSWTAVPASAAGKPSPVPQHSGDVIAGPVFIPRSPADVRADLERRLAQHNEEQKLRNVYAPTRPAGLG